MICGVVMLVIQISETSTETEKEKESLVIIITFRGGENMLFILLLSPLGHFLIL